MNQVEEKIDWLTELKIFIRFFIEAYLVLLVIQLVSEKIDNKNISYVKDIKLALAIAIILYIAKMISQDICDNVRQGMAYAVSGVFISQYPI